MTASDLEVRDVVVYCDGVESGYRIVELYDGRFAFVWGNIEARYGVVLPADREVASRFGGHRGDRGDGDRGWRAFATYEEAEAAYRECAAALGQVRPSIEAEMLAAL